MPMSKPTTFGASNLTLVPKSPYSSRLGYSPRRSNLLYSSYLQLVASYLFILLRMDLWKDAKA
jgi:hypothetical protein